MKYLLPGVLCAAAILGFWRAGVSRGAVRAGVLVPQVEARVEEWGARNVHPSRRTVDIVISDAETAALEDMLPENTEGLSAWDSHALTLGNRPSPLKKLATWFRRKFLRRSMAAAEHTAFVKSFADDPDAVVWTHNGFASAGEAEMQREIGLAAAKAQAAGACVNIVTQGISAVPALRAVEALKTSGGKGAAAPVRKFVAVDMNVPTLQRYAPQDFAKFARPKNAGEWAGVWTSVPSPETATLELFSPAYDGVRFSCNEVLAVLGVKGEATAADVIWLVKSLIRQNVPIEHVAAYIDRITKGKEQEKAADLAAKRHREEFERKKAAKMSTRPEDSLSALNAAWLAEQGAQLPGETNGPTEEPAARDPGPKRTGWENYDEKCGKCCADAGGSWDPGEDKHCCVGADYDEQVESCNVKWVDKGGRSHDCSYRLACRRTPKKMK